MSSSEDNSDDSDGNENENNGENNGSSHPCPELPVPPQLESSDDDSIYSLSISSLEFESDVDNSSSSENSSPRLSCSDELGDDDQDNENNDEWSSVSSFQPDLDEDSNLGLSGSSMSLSVISTSSDSLVSFMSDYLEGSQHQDTAIYLQDDSVQVCLKGISHFVCPASFESMLDQILEDSLPLRGGTTPMASPPMLSPTDMLKPHDPSMDDGNLCIICFELYSNRHRLVALPCGHLYGLTCIRQWVASKEECPLCKRHATLNDVTDFQNNP